MNVALLVHEWSVVALGLAVLVIDLWVPSDSKRKLGYFAALGVLGVLVYSFAAFGVSPEQTQYAFGQMFALDALALFFKRFFLLTALIVLLMSVDFAELIAAGI